MTNSNTYITTMICATSVRSKMQESRSLTAPTQLVQVGAFRVPIPYL